MCVYLEDKRKNVFEFLKKNGIFFSLFPVNSLLQQIWIYLSIFVFDISFPSIFFSSLKAEHS